MALLPSSYEDRNKENSCKASQSTYNRPVRVVNERLRNDGFASERNSTEGIERNARDESSYSPCQDHNRERHDYASSL